MLVAGSLSVGCSSAAIQRVLFRANTAAAVLLVKKSPMLWMCTEMLDNPFIFKIHITTEDAASIKCADKLPVIVLLIYERK